MKMMTKFRIKARISLICGLSLLLSAFPVNAAFVGQPQGNETLSAQDLSAWSIVEVGDSEDGSISLPIDYEVQSTTEDWDFNIRTASVGADSSQDIKLYASGAESSYFPAPYTDSKAVLSALNSRMPQTRDQGSYETCWSFSTLAAMEGSLINQQGSVPKNTDLSELHLAYHSEHYSLDNGGGNSDTVFIKEGLNYLMRGGNAYIALGALANRAGAVDESVMPYSGANATVDKWNDDGSRIPGKVAAPLDRSDYRLTGWQAYDLSSKGDWSLVKAAIRNQGAVAANINASGSYNSTYNSFYSSKTGITHAVALVGWDDDFPKSYFKGTVEGNGAWIVRNSWSTTSAMEQNSYFYLSYYNPANYASNGGGHAAYSISAVTKDNDYDRVYQYDGAIASMGKIDTGFSQQGANVFMAEDNETLKAVSFMTYHGTANADYEIKVYKGLTSGTNDPTNGKLASSNSGSITSPGLYRVKLKNPVVLNKGEVFSVAVSLKKTDYSPSLALETYNSAAGWLEQNMAVSEGQSFYRASESEKWNDVTTGEKTKTLYGNFRIKAFTDPTGSGGGGGEEEEEEEEEEEDNPSDDTLSENKAKMNLSATSLKLSPNQKVTLSVNSFEPEGALHGDVYTFTSADNNVVTVSDRGVITAVAPGKTSVAVSCDNLKGGRIKAKCTVEVSFCASTKLRLSQSGTVTLTKGDSCGIIAMVTPEEAAGDVYFISSSPRVASITCSENRCTITAGVTGKAKVTAVSGKFTKTLTVKVIGNSNTEMLWTDLGKEVLYPGETYALNHGKQKGAFMWKASGGAVSINKKTGIMTVKKAGTSVVSMLSVDGKTVVDQKSVKAAQPLIKFKINKSLVKVAVPKQGKVKKVSITAATNPGFKKYSEAGGTLSWSFTGRKWITVDTVKTAGARGAFVIDDSAVSGESVYVTATVTDPVTGEVYRDTAQILMK